jgi:hypothetical protein
MAISARLRASAGSDFVRIGLRPAKPALGKVARRKRVDHRDRDTAPLEMRGKRHPVVTGRLHDHELDRLGLGFEPGVERGEARPTLADLEHASVRVRLALPAASRHVDSSADVDPDRTHPGLLSLRPAGSPCTPVDVS